MEKKHTQRKIGMITVASIMANFAAFVRPTTPTVGLETNINQGKTPHVGIGRRVTKFNAYGGNKERFFKHWGLKQFGGFGGKTVWALNKKNAARKMDLSIVDVFVL
jgi:hypothetical protein